MAEAKRGLFSNPAAAPYQAGTFQIENAEATYSVQGAALKTLFLLGVLAVTFGYTWNLATVNYAESFQSLPEGVKSITVPDSVKGLMTLGCLGGFVVALITIFNQRLAPYTAPVYAALEGLALGAITAAFEAKYPGIALEATASTLGVSFGVFMLYSSGILRPTEKFLVGLLAAMFGILILYSVDIIMRMFGSYVPILQDNGWKGMTLQVFIVGIAALNLVVDFGEISAAAERKAPKWYEWYGAFGILVTLVWLYLEILKLLAKGKNSD